MSLRPSTRKKSYKAAAVDMEDARRRREDNLVEIRKNKRDDNLLRRRRVQAGKMPDDPFSQTHLAIDQKLESLPGMIQGVWSENPVLQLGATIQFRKFLSAEHHPIEELTMENVVPRFVEFLSRHDLPQLQFEAAGALNNISSETSEHTQVLIDHGAIPKFVQLLSSPNDEVREQAVWALGNIASDSPVYRDLVLGHGVLIPLLAQLNERSKISMLRKATWTLSVICCLKPLAPFEQTKPALQILKHLIRLTDIEVLTEACWALAYLSDGTNDKIQAVIEADVCASLVELLQNCVLSSHLPPTVLLPAVRAVGNIVTGNNAQTQCMIDNQVLPCLCELLTGSYDKSIKREICWTISNITAGNKAQIQAVIDAGIIHPLVDILHHADFDIKKEAAWAISNVIFGGSDEQIHYLVREGCIKPLCDLLVCVDLKILRVCLLGLENILRVGDAEKGLGKTGGLNIYAQLINECEGLDKIEKLQWHDNGEIYERAKRIVEMYWNEEDEEVEDAQGLGEGGEHVFDFKFS